MRASDIAIAMDELKVFQISELVDYLMEDWSFLGRSTVKTKVESTVYSWLKYKTLVRVNRVPPIFALPDYADRWREFYGREKRCPVCGKTFYSRRGSQDKYCSRKCYEKAKAKRRKVDTRKRVKNYLHSADATAVNHNQPWTKEEVKKLIQLRNEGRTYREIAQILGRTVYSVRWKAKTLKEVINAN
jgi:predicted nucleic acid-binding Zn ribbon protein